MEAVVIDRSPEQRDFLAFVLRQAGLNVSQKTDVASTIETWDDQPAALIILVLMDVRNAIDDIKTLRKLAEVPIIALGESLMESEAVELLHAGADLAFCLPIGPLLLSAYCHVLLRRTRTTTTLTTPILDLGLIELNSSTRMVRVEGKPPQRLTQLEFQLLYVLMTNRGLAIPTDVLVERVWGFSERGNRELVRGLVSRLRAKIEHDPTSPAFIHTIPGVGYLFDLETP